MKLTTCEYKVKSVKAVIFYYIVTHNQTIIVIICALHQYNVYNSNNGETRKAPDG